MFYLGLIEAIKSLENENKIIGVKAKRPNYVFGNLTIVNKNIFSQKYSYS